MSLCKYRYSGLAKQYQDCVLRWSAEQVGHREHLSARLLSGLAYLNLRRSTTTALATG